MKKIAKYAGILASVMAAVMGCNREPDLYNPQAPEDQMHVRASVASVVLLEENADQTAVTFTWDAAYNHGPGYTVEYNITFRHADMPDRFFTEPVVVAGDRSYSLTVDELNRLLARWEVVPGISAPVEVEILAAVDGPKFQMPEISKTTFTATGYSIAYYLSMVVTSGGGEPRVIPMTETIPGTDKFKWEGTLQAGDRVRFIRNAEDGVWPAWVRGDEPGTLIMKEDETEGDAAQIEIPRWSLTGPSTDIILVDMVESKWLHKTFYSLPNGLIYPVGDGAGVPWDPGVAYPITALSQPDPVNEPWIWTYTGRFVNDGAEEDAFKLLFAENAWAPGGFSAAADTDPFVKSIIRYPNDPGGDTKWKIPAGIDGTYTLRIDLSEMSLVLLPVGEQDTSKRLLAVVTRESEAPAIYPMTETSSGTDSFVWKTSALRAGDKLRFVRDASTGTWPAYVKGETAGSLALKTEAEGAASQIEITTDFVNEEEITVNMNTMTYTIPEGVNYFIPPFGMISVVGGAVEAGWDPNRARELCQMTQNTNEPWLWTYNGQFNRNGSGDEGAFVLIMAKDLNAWDPRLKPSHEWANPFTDEGRVIVNDDPRDIKWELPEGFVNGRYTLTADLKEMKLSLTMIEEVPNYFKPPFGMISVVGGAVEAGWDPNRARELCPMTQDSGKPWLWTYTGQFNRNGSGDNGAFVLIMAKDRDVWDPRLKPSHEWANPFTDEGRVIVTDDGRDIKWELPEGFVNGRYTLTVDLRDSEMKLSLTPAAAPVEALWAVVTRGGGDTAYEMGKVAGSDKFSWKGDLQAGDKVRFAKSGTATWPALVRDTDGKLVEKSQAEGASSLIEITNTFNGDDTHFLMADLSAMTYVEKNYRLLPENGAIYVVGGAAGPLTPGGTWDSEYARANCALTQPDAVNRPWIWTYTGPFGYKSAGDGSTFRILLSSVNWDPSLRPTSDMADPFTKTSCYLGNDPGGDYRWRMPEGRDGTYTLTVDLSEVSAVLQ